MTYEEIGVVIGCSGENIRKIERKAIAKLVALPECRELLEQYKDTPELHGLWDAIANDEVNIVFTRKRVGQQGGE